MKTVTIRTRTMDFEGGIVAVGGRYYQVVFNDDNPLNNYYARAADIPLEKLIKKYGIENVSWPNKQRDMNPNYKGSRNQLSRRALE